MKKRVYSPVYIYLKVVVFVNILILIIGASYFLTQNNYLLNIIPNPDYRQMLFSVNQVVLVMGGFLVTLNIVLLILVTVYNQQRYFNLMDKIDFENIPSSFNLLKNLQNFDEIGKMGDKLKETFLTYLRFSHLKKIRVELEQQKFHFLMNRLEEPALHLIQDKDTHEVKIKFINQAALKFFSLESRSLIIGHSFDFLLDKEGKEEFLNILSALEYDKSREISDKPLETSLKLLTNLKTEKKSEKPRINEGHEEILMDFYPFFMEIPWEEEFLDLEEGGHHMVLDSFLLILKVKKGFWR